jgi:isocitrate dehydrogenase (NAD+)
MTYQVTLIPGDGIGPEITAQTVKVLEATGLRFGWDEELAGMAAVDATGTPLPTPPSTASARMVSRSRARSPRRWAPAFGR